MHPHGRDEGEVRDTPGSWISIYLGSASTKGTFAIVAFESGNRVLLAWTVKEQGMTKGTNYCKRNALYILLLLLNTKDVSDIALLARYFYALTISDQHSL